MNFKKIKRFILMATSTFMVVTGIQSADIKIFAFNCQPKNSMQSSLFDLTSGYFWRVRISIGPQIFLLKSAGNIFLKPYFRQIFKIFFSSFILNRSRSLGPKTSKSGYRFLFPFPPFFCLNLLKK